VSPSICYVVFKSPGYFNRISVIQKVPYVRYILPPLQDGATMGWFDGVAHSNGQQSGAGGG